MLLRLFVVGSTLAARKVANKKPVFELFFLHSQTVRADHGVPTAANTSRRRGPQNTIKTEIFAVRNLSSVFVGHFLLPFFVGHFVSAIFHRLFCFNFPPGLLASFFANFCCQFFVSPCVFFIFETFGAKNYSGQKNFRGKIPRMHVTRGKVGTSIFPIGMQAWGNRFFRLDALVRFDYTLRKRRNFLDSQTHHTRAERNGPLCDPTRRYVRENLTFYRFLLLSCVFRGGENNYPVRRWGSNAPTEAFCPIKWSHGRPFSSS